jgi:glycosyltransferase involved in cell wall biosynthesis
MDAPIQPFVVSRATRNPDIAEWRKPSLLLIATFLSSDGGSRSVMEDLAVRLLQEGYNLVTASPYRSGVVRGAHMVATAFTRARDYDAAIVDVYSGRAFMWGEGVCSALRVLGKPYILVLRGGNLPAFAQRWPWRVRDLLNSATVVTTPSRYLFEEMKPFRKDLYLLPNPLDLGAYTVKHRVRPEPRLAWLRSFHNIYNPSLAPKVLAIIKREFPNAHLTMVGPDKGDGSLQQTIDTAARLGVSDCLRIPGGVDKADVAQWINAGDIFLNTTNVDNTPISVLEAMACGLCIVSTNVGGIPYLVEHEQDGLLVPPGDAPAMAAAVRRILAEPDLADRLSANARKKAKGFDWSIILPAWESLLDRVTKMHGNKGN